MIDQKTASDVDSENDPLFRLTARGWSVSEIASLCERCNVTLDDLDGILGDRDNPKYDKYGADVSDHSPPTDTPLKLICMDDVNQEPVGWLWEPYIPLGKITILEGDPGMGKTFFALHVAAIVSTGGAFPTSEDASGVPCNVIYQTAEDGLGDTIKARLMSAGADCKRVFVVDESETALT